MKKIENHADEKRDQEVTGTRGEDRRRFLKASLLGGVAAAAGPGLRRIRRIGCLLYKSYAADERSSVGRGGRAILKKKTETRAE